MLINSVVMIHVKENILKPNDYLSQNNTGKMYIDPVEKTTNVRSFLYALIRTISFLFKKFEYL